ncbi:hypothetical protein N7532_000128 [Penicillium argentinense]|uniref:Checkpoint protein RAD24-like helical bundle domain-containing protein n=1 Tax=Penicillium argentinense TaxID=1131581 RepID=A0A9W9G508_9EURO|nr:uncharacterized protein N7532_000128 [Penicillium argentinense]KAJ5112083.1 hypothetical protein N7532_000128 [Penicillium argentinense]
MDGRPPKRQRRTIPEETTPESAPPLTTSTNARPALSSRPKITRPRPAPPRSLRDPSSSPKQTKSKPKSLHSFFSKATEGQRWSAQKFESKPALAPAETTLDADEIEDDYDSYDEIFSELDAGKQADTRPASKPTRAVPKKTTSVKPRTKPIKRFLMPPDSSVPNTQRGSRPSIEEDLRPWAQRYAPSGLDELAVHKRKVSDVQKWLEDVFEGRRRERLLVLRGPAGSGKTATLSLLSAVLGCDVIEWRNPPVPEFASQDYVSSSAQFEEFLGRGDRFGGLDLEDASVTQKHNETPSRNRRVLLVEEFPTVLNRSSSSLAAFRTSLQRYLAAAADQAWGGWMHPPIVMIVSETLLSSASSISDNLTVHRLLGPMLYNHPSTTIIDFNSVAATFMQKALRLVLEKESQFSKRARIPGPAVLEKIAEIGDIRSAISSLEFLCLKGDQAGAWSGTLAKTKRSRGKTALTPMEHESLELISQREASLGMFHAVGKIVYNKRLDPSLIPSDATIPPSPPGHLVDCRRPKVSQVAVDELAEETGTDISTFICALHENYPPSCDGPNFTDSLNGCIEALSDSDILGADRRSSRGARGGVGIGATSLNSGVDMLRQDEISFQVASRGLIFALPYPVSRRLTPRAGHGRPGDTHKMLYPSSLRLWRKTEEIDGLVDSWMRHMLDPFSNPHQHRNDTSSHTEFTGVRSWKKLRVGPVANRESGSDHSTLTVTMMRRHDALLDQLPYMAQIKQNDPSGVQLKQITSIRGSRLDDVEDDELAPSQPPKPSSSSHAFGPQLPQEEEKLILSDDDIVDDDVP